MKKSILALFLSAVMMISCLSVPVSAGNSTDLPTENISSVYSEEVSSETLSTASLEETASSTSSTTSSATGSVSDQLLGASLGADAGIAAGYYTIASNVGSGFVMDIYAGLSSNHANTDIYTSNGSAAQVYYIRPLGDGLYEIMCCCSGLLIQACDGTAADKVNVCQGERDGSDAQKWRITASSTSGFYTISSALNSNYVLDVYAGSASNFANVDLYTANDTNAQKWSFVKTSEPQITLASGLYTIAMFGQTSYVLDILYGSKENCANLQVWGSNGTNAQKFDVEALGGGYYSIININSGRALDVDSGMGVSGTNVRQYSSNGTAAQKWLITGCPGRYKIASAINTDLCLDLYANQLTDGGNIQIYSNNNTDAQRFSFTETEFNYSEAPKPVDQGIYTIITSLDTNKAIDVPAGNYAEGVQLQLYRSNDTDAQKFQLQATSDGYYLIMNVKTGLVLTAKEAGGSSWGTKRGQSVISYNEIESDMYKNYQKWKIVPAGDGSYYLQNYMGFTLDVPAAIASDGAKLQVYDLNKSKAQRFYFIKTTTSATLRTHGYETASNGKTYWLEGTYWTDPTVSDTEFLAAAIYAEGGNQGLAGMMMIGYSMLTSLKNQGIPNMRYVIYQYGQYEICRDGALTAYLTAIADGNASSLTSLDVALTAAKNCTDGKSITLTEIGYLTDPSFGSKVVKELPVGTVLYNPDYVGKVEKGQYVLAYYDGFMTPAAWARHGFTKDGKNTLQYKGHIYYFENEVW